MQRKQYTQSFLKGRRGGEALLLPFLLLLASQIFSTFAIGEIMFDPFPRYIEPTKINEIIQLAIPLSLILPFFFLPVVVQRLHDMNKSGWFSLFFLLPLLNIFTTLFLLALPGDKEENKYGAVPTPQKVTHLIIGSFSIFLIVTPVLLYLPSILETVLPTKKVFLMLGYEDVEPFGDTWHGSNWDLPLYGNSLYPGGTDYLESISKNKVKFIYKNAVPDETSSKSIASIKKEFLTKLDEATHILVVIDEEANKLHTDHEQIGYHNWINFIVAMAIEKKKKIVVIKLYEFDKLQDTSLPERLLKGRYALGEYSESYTIRINEVLYLLDKAPSN